MAEDKHSKKHPASDQKKRQLKKKGTVPKSQDVPMATGLLAAFGVMLLMKNFYQTNFRATMEYCIESLGDVNTEQGIDILDLCFYVLKQIMVLSMPVLLAVCMAAVLSNLAMTGFILTGEQLKPNFNKLNPMTKIKQWFSVRSLQDLGKSLAKIVAAFYIGYMVWKGAIDTISHSVLLTPTGLMALGGKIIMTMFWKIIILYVVVAAIDWGFQKKNFNTEHKMTDKEVKDEYKNSEGDPYMKGKRRQMAQQIAMQQSQEHVPNSDVVVINPTEIAIALKYDPEISPVPFVLAKGEKRIADDIRESARKNGVPIVRNKPLARALNELCEIGDIVPPDFYKPVAEVLAYVFALREQAAANDAQVASNASASADAATQAQHAQSALPGDGGQYVHDMGVADDPLLVTGAGAPTAAPALAPAPAAPLELWQPVPQAPAYSYDMAPQPVLDAPASPYSLDQLLMQPQLSPQPTASTTLPTVPAPAPAAPVAEPGASPFSWVPNPAAGDHAWVDPNAAPPPS